jgi:hypothetical protein
MAECLLPEVIVFLGLIPTAGYARPSGEEVAHSIRLLINNHDALVLERHGALTVGASPMEAFMKMEVVEQNARIAFMLAQLGSHNPLPPMEVEKLLHLRSELGLCRPGESTEFCQACGVCHSGSNHLPTMKSVYRGQKGAKSTLASGPQSLPPIKQQLVQEQEIRDLVKQVLANTLGSN